MNDIVGPVQLQAAQHFRRLAALYMENRDLILMGGYAPGKTLIWIWRYNYTATDGHIQQPFNERRRSIFQALTDLFNLQDS